MKKKNKIGILTTASIFLSKIVYASRMTDVVQPEYGIYTTTPKLYGIRPTIPSDPSGISTSSNALMTIGKIAIIPVVLLVGIFAIVKINKIRNKKGEKESEEEK